MQNEAVEAAIATQNAVNQRFSEWMMMLTIYHATRALAASEYERTAQWLDVHDLTQSVMDQLDPKPPVEPAEPLLTDTGSSSNTEDPPKPPEGNNLRQVLTNWFRSGNE